MSSLDRLHEGLIKIICIPSRFQLADILTKPLGCLNFHYLLSKMGMMNIHSHLEGGCWNIQNAINAMELKSSDDGVKAADDGVKVCNHGWQLS